jgi:hypothetical protein
MDYLIKYKKYLPYAGAVLLLTGAFFAGRFTAGRLIKEETVEIKKDTDLKTGKTNEKLNEKEQDNKNSKENLNTQEDVKITKKNNIHRKTKKTVTEPTGKTTVTETETKDLSESEALATMRQQFQKQSEEQRLRLLSVEKQNEELQLKLTESLLKKTKESEPLDSWMVQLGLLYGSTSRLSLGDAAVSGAVLYRVSRHVWAGVQGGSVPYIGVTGAVTF